MDPVEHCGKPIAVSAATWGRFWRGTSRTRHKFYFLPAGRPLSQPLQDGLISLLLDLHQGWPSPSWCQQLSAIFLIRRYNRFCHQFSLAPFPLNETLLCSFATFLAQEGLRLQTIKCYLSALCHAQISNGFPDPRIGLDHPKLECILRGIKRSQATSSSVPKRTPLPITPDILWVIHSHLPHSPDSTLFGQLAAWGFSAGLVHSPISGGI